jgi:hypothetical protein
MTSPEEIQAKIQALIAKHKELADGLIDLMNTVVPTFQLQSTTIKAQKDIIKALEDKLKEYEPPEPVSQEGEHASPRP